MAGLVQNSALVPLLNISCKLKVSALKPPHRKARNRYAAWLPDTTQRTFFFLSAKPIMLFAMTVSFRFDNVINSFIKCRLCINFHNWFLRFKQNGVQSISHNSNPSFVIHSFSICPPRPHNNSIYAMWADGS